MEDADKSQECKKFPGIHKLLPEIYPELQLYNKTIKQVEGKEGMNMEWRTWQSLWRTQEEDNKSTSTLFPKERRKI